MILRLTVYYLIGNLVTYTLCDDDCCDDEEKYNHEPFVGNRHKIKQYDCIEETDECDDTSVQCSCNCNTCSGPQGCCEVLCTECRNNQPNVMFVPYAYPLVVPGPPVPVLVPDTDSKDTINSNTYTTKTTDGASASIIIEFTPESTTATTKFPVTTTKIIDTDFTMDDITEDSTERTIETKDTKPPIPFSTITTSTMFAIFLPPDESSTQALKSFIKKLNRMVEVDDKDYSQDDQGDKEYVEDTYKDGDCGGSLNSQLCRRQRRHKLGDYDSRISKIENILRRSMGHYHQTSGDPGDGSDIPKIKVRKTLPISFYS